MTIDSDSNKPGPAGDPTTDAGFNNGPDAVDGKAGGERTSPLPAIVNLRGNPRGGDATGQPGPVNANPFVQTPSFPGAPDKPGNPGNGPAARKRLSLLAVAGVVCGALFVLMTMVAPISSLTPGPIIVFALLPALFSGFAVYATMRTQGKVRGRIVAWVAVALLVLGVAIAVGRPIADAHSTRARVCGSLSWPSSAMASRLPKPESATGSVAFDSGDVLSVYACDVDAAQFKAYADAVKAKGFTVDHALTEHSFSAKNEEGYDVDLYLGGQYGDDVMHISLSTPQKDNPAESSASDESQSTFGNESQGTDGKSADTAEADQHKDGDAGATQEKTTDGQSSQTAESTVLNAQNSPDLAALLSGPDSGDSVAAFAGKYAGKEIEYDGYVANVQHHGDYKTRFDYLILAGDDDASAHGPNFRFSDVTYADLHLSDDAPDSFGTGTKVHVKATVKSYDAATGLFELESTGISMR